MNVVNFLLLTFWMAVLVGWFVVFGVASARIWRRKGGSYDLAFLSGVLLGPFALAFVVLGTPSGGAGSTGLRPDMRECPHCREPMRRDASVCPHCQRDSEPWFFEADMWWTEDEDGRLMWFHEQWEELIPTREDNLCPECGSEMGRDDVECVSCGSYSGFVELADEG